MHHLREPRPDAAGPLISSLSAETAEGHISALGKLLHACVDDGASIGFVQPFTPEDANAFWVRKVLPGLRDGKLRLLAAWHDEMIVGAVQLDCDTMPNQNHRAEVRKLLVHPRWRRRGIARALMMEIDDLARQLGRSLLTLDTRTADKAEALYTSLGYATAGVIPCYARNPFQGRLEGTTIMYKMLADQF